MVYVPSKEYIPRRGNLPQTTSRFFVSPPCFSPSLHLLHSDLSLLNYLFILPGLGLLVVAGANEIMRVLSLPTMLPFFARLQFAGLVCETGLPMVMRTDVSQC